MKMKKKNMQTLTKTEIIHYINVHESFYDKMYDVISSSENMKLEQYTITYSGGRDELHLVWNIHKDYSAGIKGIREMQLPFEEKENILNQILQFKLKIDSQQELFEFSNASVYFVYDSRKEHKDE